MLALLRDRRWLGYLALATAFAVVCCLLGMWQWNRREEARAAIDRLDRNYDRSPTALADELPNIAEFEIGQQWRPVEAIGEYMTDETLFLRGRVRGGNIGLDVIVPFRTRSGAVFLVDRGWVAQGPGAQRPLTEPKTPTGQVRIVARLRPNEGDIAGRGAPDGQIASVNLETHAADLGRPTYTGAYGLLASENGDEPADVALLARPKLDEGPHLSYTLQWFVFAAGAFGAFIWSMRRATTGVQPSSPHRRLSDAEIEDSILDRA